MNVSFVVDIVIDEFIENSTYEFLIKKINAEGALHFTLIDPDPLRQGPSKAGKWQGMLKMQVQMLF